MMAFFVIFYLLLAAAHVQGHGNGGHSTRPQQHDAPQGRSTALLGDLIHLSEKDLTTSGSDIWAILTGAESAMANDTTYTVPGPKGSDACALDACCIWSYIVKDMIPAFRDVDQCSSLARGAVRQGFHDAAAWNSSLSCGGADGSLLLSGELSRPENAGLEAIAAQTMAWYGEYAQYGVSMADLIQMGANTAAVVCPGGPRVRSFVGRPDSNQQPPRGLLPLPSQNASYLVQLFQAKTFTAADLVALVGAHTVSQQFFVDPSRAGEPQDSTDGIWDVLFYSQTLAGSDPQGVYRFHSDLSLSRYSATQGTWRSFVGPGGAEAWQQSYASAYFRMSLLGVKQLNNLTECTDVLPLPRISD